MKPKKRQKMCGHCEGEVDLDVIVCPFCAADLREEKNEISKPIYNPTAALKNLSTQASLYPPHYAPKAAAPAAAVAEEAAPATENAEEEPTQMIWGPVLLMTLGAQLLLFGLFMLFFSQNGQLVLKWDARLWFFYILASIPLLAFGYKAVNKISE
jgi:hypothetical protein